MGSGLDVGTRLGRNETLGWPDGTPVETRLGTWLVLGIVLGAISSSLEVEKDGRLGLLLLEEEDDK